MKNKIIFLDYGMFLHRAIFAWRNNKEVPVEYTCLNMMLSCLRKVGVEPYDTIIVAVDYGHSWRKEVEKQYKGDRAEKRKTYEDINWKIMYGKMDALLKRIDVGTDWHIVKSNHLEADDWMAVGSRYYKDDEVILVTFDADMEQLTSYDNVKVFSPMIKMKGRKGGYKIVKDPYAGLAKKINKEQADNLTNPVLNEEDYEKRKMVVSLLELPDFVEDVCRKEFDNFKSKEEINIEAIPFTSMRDKINSLYNDKSQVVTYEDSVKALENKNKKKAKAKQKKRMKKVKSIRKEK